MNMRIWWETKLYAEKFNSRLLTGRWYQASKTWSSPRIDLSLLELWQSWQFPRIHTFCRLDCFWNPEFKLPSSLITHEWVVFVLFLNLKWSKLFVTGSKCSGLVPPRKCLIIWSHCILCWWNYEGMKKPPFFQHQSLISGVCSTTYRFAKLQPRNLNSL